MTRKEYVVSKPTGFHLATNLFHNQMRQLHDDPPVLILESIDDEESDKLVSMTDEEATRLKARMPGLIIEPNVLYKTFRHPILDGFGEISLPASGGTKTITIRVTDIGSSVPLPNVTVYLTLDSAQNIGFRGLTDDQGECHFTTRSSSRDFANISLVPNSGYWSRRIQDFTVDNHAHVALLPLPSMTTQLYDWGHEFAVMEDGLGNAGEGVTVGVIDTGIRRDHQGLVPEGGVNCVFNEDPTLWYDDALGHGTHCAGIISAITAGGVGIKGYAPRAKLRAYRVFGRDAEGASTFDIAKAIQRAVADGCDVISMSLGSPSAQSAIRTKTELAYDNGVLCIAATGNEASDVSYPAAFPTVIGVGAFGKIGAYPVDSLHSQTESPHLTSDGKYFLANFSNFGDNIDFIAPGVAITSTVPGGYGAWDGTSMACPQIAGMAALALSANPAIFNAPRDSARVDSLLQILKTHVQPLGFGVKYEGAGCLKVPPLLL